MATNGLPAMLVLALLVPALTAMSRTELEVWRTQCPFTDFCTVNSIQRPNLTHHSCCSKCSCDDDCWVFKNCCPDGPDRQITDTRRATCRTVCLETTNTMYTSDCRIEFPSYRVIDFCPPEIAYIDPLTKGKCEGGLIDDLEDGVAVSDAKSRIYKNKHCAKCQGANQTTSWILELHSCTWDINTSSLPASQYLAAILEHCLITSVPPDGSEVRFKGMLCGGDLHSTCSSSRSGKGSSHHANVDRCINGPYIPYMYQYQTGRRIFTFKNVFCLLCSRDYPLEPHHVCLISKNELAKDNSKSFSVLLDTTVDTAIRSKLIKQHRCGETELYDHVKDLCVTLACPPYSLVMYGDCISMGLAMYPYLLQIVYTTTTRHTFPEPIQTYDVELTQKYARKSLRYYGLARCNVDEFTVNVFVVKKTSRLAFVVIKLIVVSDDTCNIDYISEVATTRLSVRHKTSVLINGQYVKLSGRITFYTMDYDHPLYTWHTLITLYLYQTSRAPIISDFFLCPHFKIGAYEYNAITTDILRDGHDRNISDISELTHVAEGFYVLNANSIAVCVDTYFKLYEANKCRSLKSTQHLWHWVCQIVSLFVSGLTQ